MLVLRRKLAEVDAYLDRLGAVREQLRTQLNSDDNPRATRTHGVMSLPTLLVFRQGTVVASIVGARPKTHLRQALTAQIEG